MVRCPLDSFGPVKLSIAFYRYEICCMVGVRLEGEQSWVCRRFIGKGRGTSIKQ